MTFNIKKPLLQEQDIAIARRYWGTCPQSPATNAFNKGMLKQVQHDEVIFGSAIKSN